MPNITLHVSEPDAVTLKYVEAKIKPEQVGSAVPSWEPKTVTPDPGCVFSAVEIAGMPEPTAVLDITENGEYPVERIGVANVAVPQGVFPSGTLEIIQNNVTVNVEQYETAEVQIPEVLSGGIFEIRKFLVVFTGETAEINFASLLGALRTAAINTYDLRTQYADIIGIACELLESDYPLNGLVAAAYGRLQPSSLQGVYWNYDGSAITKSTTIYMQYMTGIVQKNSRWSLYCVCIKK